MEYFVNRVQNWKLLTILEKRSTSDVWLGSESASVSYYTVNLTRLVFLSHVSFQWKRSFSITTISSGVVAEVVASVTI